MATRWTLQWNTTFWNCPKADRDSPSSANVPTPSTNTNFDIFLDHQFFPTAKQSQESMFTKWNFVTGSLPVAAVAVQVRKKHKSKWDLSYFRFAAPFDKKRKTYKNPISSGIFGSAGGGQVPPCLSLFCKSCFPVRHCFCLRLLYSNWPRNFATRKKSPKKSLRGSQSCRVGDFQNFYFSIFGKVRS